MTYVNTIQGNEEIRVQRITAANLKPNFEAVDIT